ncbi:actin cytoskeleton-regulatory complex protein pan1-like isoform X2 [Varroa jacobsoni]|uniref:actin cytoskeleton-regulatory complex protein pan1-like isoform X2 n=1 Tax=Varroa jacobsoni TaxID=62625 RepID=UPI000BF31211|nr:actin cytoskeleton-regulatory complex protein pan1-like isoform X2 [Varroa jacobsoni]
MSSYADEPLPPGVNPDDNKSDDDNELLSIPTPPLPPGAPPPPPNAIPNFAAAAIKRSDSPYSIGDSLSEPESDDCAPLRGLADDLLPPGVEKGDNKDNLPAVKPLPPPPKFVLDDELCKKLAQRKVKCYFIETMVNMGLPKEAFEALAANPHPNLLCREMVKRRLWPPPPPGAMDDLPHLELFDDPEGPVFPEGLHTLIKRLTPLHDEEGTPLARLPPGSVPLIEMASRIYGEALQRCRESAQPKYRIPSPEYVPLPPPVARPETPPLPPTPQPVPESKKRVKKLLEQKLAARKAQIELNQNSKTFNFSHLVNMRNALRREEKEELALPRDDDNSTGATMASILNDDSSQEDSDVSSNLPTRSSPTIGIEEGEILTSAKTTRSIKLRGATLKVAQQTAVSPVRPVVVAKRALSPDNEANSSVAKRKERRRRWDVLPNGVKLDAADEVEESINLKENRSNAVKLETLKGRTSGKTEKEQDADSNIVKAGKSTNRKDALRKLSFGTEEEDLEKRREEEKKLAEERRMKELEDEAIRQQIEADLKAKEVEERQRRKREQQEADRKRLEELEAKRRAREAEHKTKKDSKFNQNDRMHKAPCKVDSKERSDNNNRKEDKKPKDPELEANDAFDNRKETKLRGERNSDTVEPASKEKDTKKRTDKNKTDSKNRESEDSNTQTAKRHDDKKRSQGITESSMEREANDRGRSSVVVKSEAMDKSLTENKTIKTEVGDDGDKETDKPNDKPTGMNPKLQELAKAMQVAVGPVAVAQERLLEMVLKTLLKEIQAPQVSGELEAVAATSGTTAGQATSTLIPISTEQQVINNLPATSAQTSTDAELSTKSKTMASPKPDQGKSIELDKMKSGNDLSPEKGIKQECAIPVDDICSRSGKSVDGNVQATSGNEKDEVETVVDRTFKRHLRFPIFGIRCTNTEPPLRFSANLAHQKDLIALVDRVRPVESIVSRRSVESIKTLEHIVAMEDDKLSPTLDKLEEEEMARQGDVDEAEFLGDELLATGVLGMAVLEGDHEDHLTKPVNNKNLIEITPTASHSESDGATYTGNLLEVPIVCAAESTSSPSSAGQSSAVSQQDSPESTTGPPKSNTGLPAKPKAARAKSVSFFDGTVPEKDPQVRSPPPPSPSLTERRRNRQGQKVPLLPPATLVLAAQGRKRPGSPPPAPTPPPPPGRPSILYIENPITHQLYEVIHPGNGLVMTPGGLADVRADPANHKYIYAEVEGAEAAGPVLVENFMPRVHLFPYLVQAMANTGTLL